MEHNRNSDRSKEGLRHIIRDEIRRSRADGGENLYVRTQALIRETSSALASSVNVISGSSPLASSTSPSTNLTVLSGLSESPGPSNLNSYSLSVNENNRQRQPVHLYRLKPVKMKSIMKKEPKTYQLVLLEEDENKSESYRYSDEMLLGTWFIDLFPDEKEEDIKMNLSDVFQSIFPLISSNLFEFVKCCRRNISVSAVWNDFKWYFGHIKSHAVQGKLYVRLIVPTHVVTENVSDEESSLETSTLGSTTTSSYDIPNMSYASSLTNTSHSTNTSSVEPQQYHSQTSTTPYIESTNNTEMVSVGLFDATEDIQTLVNQLLDAELPAVSQLFQALEESLTIILEVKYCRMDVSD